MEALLIFLTEFIAPVLGHFIFDFGISAFPSSKSENGKYLFYMFFMILIFVVGAVSGFFYPAALVKWPLLLLLNFIISPFMVAYLTKRLGEYLEARQKMKLKLDTFWLGYFSALVFMVGRFVSSFY